MPWYRYCKPGPWIQWPGYTMHEPSATAPSRGVEFSVTHSLYTGSGTHTVFYPLCTSSSHRVRRPGHEANQSLKLCIIIKGEWRSQWPRGLRRGSSAVRLLRLWVQIPPREWRFVYCKCCVLLGRGFCDELITRPEESYRLWWVVVCDLETSWMRPWPNVGCRAPKNEERVYENRSSKC
jgi:hypothetical protein